MDAVQKFYKNFGFNDSFVHDHIYLFIKNLILKLWLRLFYLVVYILCAY